MARAERCTRKGEVVLRLSVEEATSLCAVIGRVTPSAMLRYRGENATIQACIYDALRSGGEIPMPSIDDRYRRLDNVQQAVCEPDVRRRVG